MTSDRRYANRRRTGRRLAAYASAMAPAGRQHQNLLLAVLAAIAIVCASALVWTWHARQSADQSLADAVRRPRAGRNGRKSSNGARTPAAPLALLALANAQYHNGAPMMTR